METKTIYFKNEPHFLIDQPRTCCIFIFCCSRKSIFLNESGNQFSLYIVCLEVLFLRNRNRFYLNSRSYSEINSICSNKRGFISVATLTQNVKGGSKALTNDFRSKSDSQRTF